MDVFEGIINFNFKYTGYVQGIESPSFPPRFFSHSVEPGGWCWHRQGLIGSAVGGGSDHPPADEGGSGTLPPPTTTLVYLLEGKT